MTFKPTVKLLLGAFLSVFTTHSITLNAQCYPSGCSYCYSDLCNEPCKETADPTQLDNTTYLAGKANKHFNVNGEHNECSLYFGKLYIEALGRNDWKTYWTSSAQDNDIILFGDSQFDLLDTGTGGGLPRTHNFPSLGGAHIVTTTWATNEMFKHFDPLGTGTLKNKTPSQVWVHAGGNDLAEVVKQKMYDCGTYYDPIQKVKSNFDDLVCNLLMYKNELGCKITICSVPAFRTINLTGNPTSDTQILNMYVNMMNSYIESECVQHDFIYADYHSHLWDDVNNEPHSIYYWDSVHMNEEGYKLLLSVLAKSYHPVLSTSANSLSGIPNSPTAIPPSTTQTGSYYKYIHTEVAPGQTLQVTTAWSSVNYVALFDPESLSKAPIQEAVNSTLSYTNTTAERKTFVVCVGSTSNAIYSLNLTP